MCLLVAVALAGCGAALRRGESPAARAPVAKAPAAAAALPPLPFPEPENVPDRALTPDIVYSILVAELAIQRGDPALAYSHYMYGASLSGDARAARQATRIATGMRDLDRAIAAVERWIALAPNRPQARASAVMIYLQAEQLEPAVTHLVALVKISRALGQDGFMRAVAVVSRSADPALGVQAMRRLAEAFPDEPQARYALALVAATLKQYAVAEQEARALLASDAARVKSYLLLSNVLYSQGKAAEAEQVLEKALDATPENRLLRTAYARLLMQSEKLPQAYAQFRRVEQLAPGDPDVLYMLGILAIELQQTGDARAYLQQLIAQGKGKRVGDAAYFMARTYEAEDHPDEAIAWYGRVSRGDYVVEARTRIARLLALGGDLSRAREKLQQLRHAMPHQAEAIFLAEGEILQELGRNEEALALLGKALAQYPDSQELLYLRALSAAPLQRLDLVEQDLKRILRENPAHADALNALGYTLADQTGRYQEALGYIQKALALKPDAGAILDSMGWVQYRLGNYPEALRYLRQAMERLPDPEVAAHLGEVLWVSGQRDAARKTWRDALRQHPESPYLLETMRRFNP